MKKELRSRILAYNKALAERTQKAGDLDYIVSAIGKLPPGQLRKLLTDDVLSVLEKYNVAL